MARVLAFSIIVLLVLIAACSQAVLPEKQASSDAQHAQEQVQKVVQKTPLEQEKMPAEKQALQEFPATEATPPAETAPITDINVEAFQFGYEPSVIRLKLGDQVTIHLSTRDVPHSMVIPQLGFILNAAPETPGTQVLKASKRGTFTWYCSIPCGSGHGEMEGTLIVE